MSWLTKTLDRLKRNERRAADISPIAPKVRTMLWQANRDRALKGVDFTGKPYARLA
jgi:hypothetical protein